MHIDLTWEDIPEKVKPLFEELESLRSVLSFSEPTRAEIRREIIDAIEGSKMERAKQILEDQSMRDALKSTLAAIL